VNEARPREEQSGRSQDRDGRRQHSRY
jgi:hypothetical protein